MPAIASPFDSLYLDLGTINLLMKKGYVKYNEARNLLKDSFHPNYSEEEKEEILDELIVKKKK